MKILWFIFVLVAAAAVLRVLPAPIGLGADKEPAAAKTPTVVIAAAPSPAPIQPPPEIARGTTFVGTMSANAQSQGKPALAPAAGVMKPVSGDRNQANRLLMAFTEKDRRERLWGILNLNGERCAEVTRTFYQGSARPSWNAVWSVECKGGPSYKLLIFSDEVGSAKILTCGQSRAIGAGECFVKMD